MEKFYKPVIIALGLAVIALFVLHFTDRGSQPENNAANPVDTQAVREGNLKVAYVFVDSVLANYEYYKVLTDKLLADKASLEQELSRKGDAWQKDVNTFQNKVDKHLITSWDAEAEQKKLAERQQVLVNLQSDMQQRLLANEQAVTLQLHDSMMSAVNDVNSKLAYNVILSNTFGGGLLYAEDYMNITAQVLERLNESYRKSQGK